ADARAQRDQLAHDVGADEAGAPGDEDRLHEALASVASAAATVLSAASVPARSSSRSPSAVAPVSAAVTARNGRTRPSSLTAAARAAGIPRSASSDTPRTTAAGTSRPRAHAMMAADSMSTASAPVSIQRRAFWAADSTTAPTVRSAPSPDSRGSAAVGQRPPGAGRLRRLPAAEPGRVRVARGRVAAGEADGADVRVGDGEGIATGGGEELHEGCGGVGVAIEQVADHLAAVAPHDGDVAAVIERALDGLGERPALEGAGIGALERALVRRHQSRPVSVASTVALNPFHEVNVVLTAVGS